MERKAASQYSEQTVWRPTIIHSLDSDKSNAPNISENDIRVYIRGCFEASTKTSSRGEVQMSGQNRTKRASRTPR